MKKFHLPTVVVMLCNLWLSSTDGYKSETTIKYCEKLKEDLLKIYKGSLNISLDENNENTASARIFHEAHPFLCSSIPMSLIDAVALRARYSNLFNVEDKLEIMAVEVITTFMVSKYFKKASEGGTVAMFCSKNPNFFIFNHGAEKHNRDILEGLLGQMRWKYKHQYSDWFS